MIINKSTSKMNFDYELSSEDITFTYALENYSIFPGDYDAVVGFINSECWNVFE